MLDFINLINNKKLQTFKANISKGTKQAVLGLSSELKGLFLALCEQNGIFVAKDLVSSGKVAQMLSGLGCNVKFIVNPYQNSFGLVDKNLQFEFISIINDFIDNKINYLIITPEALFQKIPNINELKNNNLIINKNNKYKLELINKKLIEMGYTRVDYISNKSQFTLKGDVLQIYPINMSEIVKIEFFDTEIEKISLISFDEKKYIKNIDEIKILYFNYENNNCNLLDLSNNIFYDEPKQIYDIAENYSKLNEYDEFKSIFKTKAKSQTAFVSVTAKTFFVPDEYCNFNIYQSKNYIYDFKDLLQDVKFYLESGKNVFCFCKNEKNKDILNTFFEDNFLFANIHKGTLTLTTDFMPYSANLVDSDSIFIGTYNLFKKEKVQIKNSKKSLFIPKIGEYVVHESYGVGRCVGLEKLNLNGALKDYFILEYFGGDKYYLPSEQADMLTSYYTSETTPKLNKLGGTEFAKIKEKVYKNVKQIAFDLLNLYAKRETSKGHKYVKDDYLMEQFENAFPFDETPDQLRAIADIKSDMEGDKIMDRLVCGDVGFGKTEVALRAIYKAVLSGRQVAFLCPTTILSEQHYKTCKQRFNGFMVKTARFNRLMPKSEEKNVLAELENGRINVVCGTHKLLGEKVKFKNIGLLVLDEEQRFGVEDKEKIKNLKNDIDVLSLSATPIPRTLHMSLSGIRDISIIDTPPKERQPIQTFITEFDDELVTRAITQELSRNGQVLMIYNRIDTIYEFAKKISNLVPNARIGVAHGRLSQKLLEDSILKLYSHEYDILVSTTLIENGIDLPSANTLIVVDADKLGLAQLYQIRGRIGRSNKNAYAYLTFASNKQLTDMAYQRLSALMENTSLGSGYKIAMADLDIRGAGNVLGSEQHGNMLKVGYDLYYKLLNVAIKEIKGEQLAKTREVKLDIAVDAYIPETFIANENERIKIISEVSEINSKIDYLELKNNLTNVYGALPLQVSNLLTLGYIKYLAQKAGVKRILTNISSNILYFYDKQEIILDKTFSISQKVKELINVLEK